MTYNPETHCYHQSLEGGTLGFPTAASLPSVFVYDDQIWTQDEEVPTWPGYRCFLYSVAGEPDCPLVLAINVSA